MSATSLFDSIDFNELDLEDMFETDEQSSSPLPDYLSEFEALLSNCYHFNPDTLMPLLLITLVVKDKLRITLNDARLEGAYKSFNLILMQEKEWVQCNTALKNRIKSLLQDHITTIHIETILDSQTAPIYALFRQHDEVTMVHEYHERIGLLSDHTHVDQVQKDYAILIWVEYLLNHSDDIRNSYAEYYDKVLVASGLQPKRPRLENAEMMKALLKYSQGSVYVPFAGVNYIGAMIHAERDLYADGTDPRILAAGQLFNYGEGGCNESFEQHDSIQWRNRTFDYVASTYRGLVNDRPAFCFCLDKCFTCLSEHGRYVGVIKSDDLFDTHQPEVTRAIDEDILDALVIMPHNETIVLINRDKQRKGKIRIYDRRSNWVAMAMDMEEYLNDEDEVKLISTAELRRNKYNLKKYILQGLTPISGQEIVSIKQFIRPIPRRTYDTSKLNYREKALLNIDRSLPYSQIPNGWMEGLEKSPFDVLLNPVYHLNHDALIINKVGKPEPRLFDADRGAAYFEDGLAFEFNPPFDMEWFIGELNENYVLDQLQPYGCDAMMPNQISEEVFLSLKLYKPIGSNQAEDDLVLKAGTVLHDTKGNMDYTIIRYLSNGSFGTTYRATRQDLLNGDMTEVVIKEFFARNTCYREGTVVKYHNEYSFQQNYQQFLQEAQIMMKLGNIPDSHIMQVYSCFESEETGTAYYVMKAYDNGDLESLMKKQVLDEDMVINNIIKPVTKALSVAHACHLLHLDIKPDNIMIDENGMATLTDFGLAKDYDEDGNQKSFVNPNGCRYFAAPEQIFHEDGNALVRFAPQTDIYLLAGTLYNLMTREQPHHIMDFSDQDVDIREHLSLADCSNQFADAIVAGLQNSAIARPADAQEFLNLFPGCENIKL